MSNTIRIKRRLTGAAGAPASLQNAELAYNEVDDVLYYGKGTGGGGGSATTVIPIAGAGAYVGMTGDQTVAGSKTFSSPINASLAGNASTATALATARNINGVAFDGTGDVTITATTANSLTAGTGLLGGPFNGSNATTLSVDATSISTASKIVTRDASGNFAANIITAAINGNSTTASALATSRAFSYTGDLTGSGEFDGSANSSIALTLATSGVTAGTYRSVTVNEKGLVTAGTNPITLAGYGITDAVNSSALGTANGVATLGADGKVPAGQLPSFVDDILEFSALENFPVTGETSKIYTALDTNKIYRWGGTVYIEISATAGNADSATKLATARTISATGDATWSVNFDGSTNATAAITLAASGVAAGTYGTATSVPVVVVNEKGLVTGVTQQAITFPVTTVAGRTGEITLSTTDISGLGTMATQSASSVAITGGTIDGVVFDGGTF